MVENEWVGGSVMCGYKNLTPLFVCVCVFEGGGGWVKVGVLQHV